MKEERKAAVLFLYEVKVVGPPIDLKDGVPVWVVVDALVGGEEHVDDGEDLVRAFEKGFSFLREEGELARTHQITVLEKLLRDPNEALRFVACCVVHSEAERRMRTGEVLKGAHSEVSHSGACSWKMKMVTLF
ncbi:hypothetical protein V8G54_036329 [Vigna mungo]|uniref:Uncharacterized protein n=1 Tax=Vigna mungo TaxID=3915 RepID=A0AAQ3MH64_VIGMU